MGVSLWVTSTVYFNWQDCEYEVLDIEEESSEGTQGTSVQIDGCFVYQNLQLSIDFE